MRLPDAEDVFSFGFHVSLLAIVLGLVGLSGWAVYGSVRSNGEADYCYVEMWSPGSMSPQYQLHAHRPWRVDRILGNYPTLDAAAAEAATINCPMGKR